MVIPDSVKYIEDGAFKGCKRLEKVKLSQNLTKLGGDVFSLYENLKKLDLPTSLRRIGTDCFFCGNRALTLAHLELCSHFKRVLHRLFRMSFLHCAIASKLYDAFSI